MLATARYLGSLAAATLTLLGLALAPGAHAEVGHLRQLRGQAGCLHSTQLPVVKNCARTRFAASAAGNGDALAVSPNGRNLYLASGMGTVSVFRIRHGRLSQLPGRAGCLGQIQGLGCARLERFAPGTISISPDGRSVYVSGQRGAYSGAGLVIFARNPRTGTLHELNGAAGCLGHVLPHCQAAGGLVDERWSSTMSPDGHTVYVTSADQSGTVLGVFARVPSGKLRQLPGAAGCLNHTGGGGCTVARGPFSDCCLSVPLSPDSRNVYIAANAATATLTSSSFGLLSFARDRATGALTQLPGVSGCVALLGLDGCETAPFDHEGQVFTAVDVAISPNGRDVYLAHRSGGYNTDDSGTCGRAFDYTAVFSRDPVSGALGGLEQDAPSCGSKLVVPRDGGNIYTVPDDDGWGIGSMTRDRSTGLLTFASCIGEFWRRCRPMHRPDPLKRYSPSDAAVTPDGRYVYMTVGVTIGIFQRSLR